MGRKGRRSKGSDARRRSRFKDLIRRVKLEEGCVECGYNDSVHALALDHLDEFRSVPRARDQPNTWAEFGRLMEQTEVRCANCHCIRHSEEMVKYA